MVRKKWRGPLVAVFALLLLILALASDALIERAIETAGEKIAGARVELDGLRFSIFNLRLRWQRMQVTNSRDTWNNLFETGYADLNLGVEPLLYKRVVIENMRLDNLQFGTPRTTNGALRSETASTEYVQELQGRIEGWLQSFPVYNLARLSEPDIDSIIEILGLQSPQRIDSLRKETQAKTQSWQRRIDAVQQADYMRQLRLTVDTLDVQNLKARADVIAAIRTINTARQTLDSAAQLAEGAGQEIRKDIGEAREYRKLANTVIEHDVQRIMDLAVLPQIDRAVIAEVLFGRAFADRLTNALMWIGMARHYTDRARAFMPEKERTVPRLSGQDIPFPNRRRWPTFWLQNAAITAQLASGISLGGFLRNATTETSRTGLPVLFLLSGKSPQGASLTLNGLLDYTKDRQIEQLGLSAQNIDLSGFSLGKSSLLPLTVEKGVADFTGQVEMRGRSLTARGSFAGKAMSFAATDSLQPDAGPFIADIRSSLAPALRDLRIEFGAGMTAKGLEFTMSSNVDALITERIRQELAPAANKIATGLRREIDARTMPKKDALETTIKAAEREGELRITEIDGQIDALSDRIAQLRRAAAKKLLK